MAKDYTFLDFAQEVLERVNQPLSPKDIWENGVKLGLDKNINSLGKTPEATTSAQLYVNVKKDNSIFYIISKRPTLFWLTGKDIPKSHQQKQESQDTENETQKTKYKERDLHPLLVQFADSNFNAYCKTIYHENSVKEIKGKNKWVHPDIVGVYFPFADSYKNETLGIIKNTKDSFKLYSFELKRELNWGNLKESYFQAVSNSSWANEGYLVVFKKIDDEDMKKELTRLNASFGIGVIEIQISPDGTIENNVLLPSKIRELDIETINLLVEENQDFKEFIEAVNKDVEISDKHRIGKQFYDKVLDDEEIIKILKKA